MINANNSSNTSVIRANQNGILLRHAYIASNGSDVITYTIYDNKGRCTTYASNSRKNITQSWNRNYRNSRQYASPSGVNHRFMS